jgi:hypothetical protein
MKKVLIFGGLALIGYALYNKFVKKDKSNLGGALSTQTNTSNVETPTAENTNLQPNIGLGGVKQNVDNNEINVIDTVTIERPTTPKRGKFTPNRPIGRPRVTRNCECKQEPCNC